MSVYLTSDLHIGHKNIVKFTNRPWTFEEQTEEIVKRWNEQVGPGDHVYHLGDFTFAGISKLNEVWDVVKRLNGKKHFIFGNHCNRNLWKLIEHEAHANDMQDEVILLGDYHELKIDKKDVVLCHYPLREWNKKHYGSYMLFGHTHGSLQIEGERSMDVGIDNHPEHKLFSWEEVKERMESIPLESRG